MAFVYVLLFMLAVLFAVLLFCFYMQWRNNRVFNYRGWLADRIDEANRKDIAAGLGYTGWRYKELERVSYDSMMSQWWKPLDSFYPDKSFLEASRP